MQKGTHTSEQRRFAHWFENHGWRKVFKWKFTPWVSEDTRSLRMAVCWQLCVNFCSLQHTASTYISRLFKLWSSFDIFLGITIINSIQVKAVVRLVMPAANARPGPQIGQALGPLGLNMAQVFHRTVQIICNIFSFRMRKKKLLHCSSVKNSTSGRTIWFLMFQYQQFWLHMLTAPLILYVYKAFKMLRLWCYSSFNIDRIRSRLNSSPVYEHHA